MIRDTFPFRPARVESTDDIQMFRITRMENVVNPRAIVQFMSSGDKGNTQ
jgi:hypothetical protein